MRCEGYRRHGGIFTLGPVKWVQCEEEAVVRLEVKQKEDDGTTVFPACLTCWKEAVNYDDKYVKVLAAEPITEEEENVDK